MRRDRSIRSGFSAHENEEENMKIVFTTSGNDMNAPLDQRFGRAPKFIVYDLDADTFEAVDNRQNMNASQGAGIQSAETVVRLGADVVVTGHCGPKAFHVLMAAGVKIYNTNVGTVVEALAEYREGKLAEASNADVAGHWV
jgi:predicted Fe-Mo cluster-binding NifX family protein